MKTKLLLFVLLSTGFLINAQNGYNFSVTNEPYNNLVGSTSLNNGQIWDDLGYAVPIGFDFQISAQVFSTIYFPDFGLGGTLSNVFDEDDEDAFALIIPIGQDLIDLGYGIGGSQSNLSYKTEGTAGSQILKIEWNNVGFFDDQTTSDFMNFQVWLYEGSNIIEYRYGPNQINNPQGSFEGETGPIVALFPLINFDIGEFEEDAYFISGDPSNPTVIIVEAGDEPHGPIALQGMIPDGTVYTFSPQNLSVDDYATIDFAVYPNPAGNYFNIRANALEYQVNIYNNLGQKVKHFDNSSTQIDVTGLPAGLYLIEVETERGSSIKKLIKK
jgi:hypothetical protein